MRVIRLMYWKGGSGVPAWHSRARVERSIPSAPEGSSAFRRSGFPILGTSLTEDASVFSELFCQVVCRTTHCWRLSGRSRLSGSILTWANPNRLRAARMASNFGAAGSATSTVHRTGLRLPLPLTNKFPSSGNPASANAPVTACVSSVYRAIRYRMDAKSLGLVPT